MAAGNNWLVFYFHIQNYPRTWIFIYCENMKKYICISSKITLANRNSVYGMNIWNNSIIM